MLISLVSWLEVAGNYLKDQSVSYCSRGLCMVYKSKKVARTCEYRCETNLSLQTLP